MAVLAEALSLVIKVESLLNLSTENQVKFTQNIPNKTFCGDGELIRIDFMNPADVQSYADTLNLLGLVFMEDGRAKDFVVVDQLRGPTTDCSWVDFGEIELGDTGNSIKSCRLKGSSITQVSCPTGWSFENSLSKKTGYIDKKKIPTKLKFLRKEGHQDVYLDKETGKEVFIGRSSTSAKKEDGSHD